MKKFFCENCLEDKKCTYKEEFKKKIIDNIEVEYLEKFYVCNECHEKIYGDMFDYNIHEINKKMREKTGLITVEEIQEILDKYAIGKKPLSIILGIGEVNIIRYLEGKNPSKEISDLLKMIKDNPALYEIYLLDNKDNITNVAFRKSLGKVKQLELTQEHSKLYQVSLYILKKSSETTPLALQKILYFLDGFSRIFLEEKIFSTNAEAWVNGPVYKDIYESFSYYKWEKIDYKEILKDYDFNLDAKEIELANQIITSFGCYNGDILREMSHLTYPWIEARVGLEPKERTNREIEDTDMISYFNNICKDYSIKNLNDIEKYSYELMNKARNNLANQD